MTGPVHFTGGRRAVQSPGPPERRWASRLVRLGAVLALLPGALAAHDIPARVTALVFVKPQGGRLEVLVRVPLEAMRDIVWPVRGPGYLELDRVDSLLRHAARVWIAPYLEFYEEDRRLAGERIVAARVSLPRDRSFERYELALAHLGAPPLDPRTEIIWNQALLDLRLHYPIASERSRFAVRPGLAHLGLQTTTVLRFLPPGGAERVFQYRGDPGLVRLDPRWHQAAARFVRLGWEHILGGVDHLLFVFCLVIPFRRLRPLVVVVTAFTLAHSLTLGAAVLGWVPRALWFPPLVETLIAGSILYTALENIVSPSLGRRWLVAFGFGLVHGFGFSFALRESLQFAGRHVATALVAFNLGVELGQIAVLALLVPLLDLLFRRVVAERLGTVLLSAVAGHSAWHWMADRFAVLRQYRFQWPALDRALVLGLTQGLMVVLVLAGGLWALYGAVTRFARRGPAAQPAGGGLGGPGSELLAGDSGPAEVVPRQR